MFAEPWREYYAAAYCRVFMECRGAPLHDAMVVAYLLEPDMFTNQSEVIITSTTGASATPSSSSTSSFSLIV